jgi:hypothetical protein
MKRRFFADHPLVFGGDNYSDSGGYAQRRVPYRKVDPGEGLAELFFKIYQPEFIATKLR